MNEYLHNNCISNNLILIMLLINSEAKKQTHCRDYMKLTSSRDLITVLQMGKWLKISLLRLRNSHFAIHISPFAKNEPLHLTMKSSFKT